MPLRLVLVQNLLYLEIEGAIEGGQAFGQILMYRRFADPKFLGGRAYRCPVFDDVRRQFAGALLDVSFQILTLPLPFCHKIYMWGEGIPCL